MFFAELGALYDAFTRGRAASLPPLAVQYADYVLWQRSSLQSELLDRQLAYWRAQLAGAPAVLELPVDRAHPPVFTHHGARQAFRVGPEVHRALLELARGEGATLFMTLLAAFQVVLGHYSNSTDVVVSTPIAGRTRAEFEPLIGLFVNTLVLRTDLSGDPTFRELLARVRQVTLEAYTHQDFPFEQLVNALDPACDLSRIPLVQVSFQLFNAPHHELSLTGLEVTPFPRQAVTTRFCLDLRLQEIHGELTGRAVYSTDLFDHSTITRLVSHFMFLLEAITTHPHRRLSQLNLLTTADRH